MKAQGIEGMLLAIKANAHKELYRGMTALDGQRIEAALSDHLGQSDQVDVLWGQLQQSAPVRAPVAFAPRRTETYQCVQIGRRE